MMESSAWVLDSSEANGRLGALPGARGGLSTLRPDIDPAIGAMTRYTSPSRSGWRWGWRRGVAEARFTFPKTGTHANYLKAHARTPRRNSGASAALRARMTAADLDPSPVDRRASGL